MQEKHLTTKQVTAIDLIMAGLTDTEIAAQLNITRQTISRWRNDNPAFAEALQTRRNLIRERHMEAFSRLVEQAIAIIQEGLDSQDERVRLKTAMFVMRVSGLQGYAKPAKQLSREEKGKADLLATLEAALTEVHQEMGIKPPDDQ